MEYRFLGRSGLKVSTICLGTMTFNDAAETLPTQCSEDVSHEILDRFVELGGNFVDTANIYTAGKCVQ
jgi:aryl-alcohol dehydrogenase-like predicted oxidoreductase